MNKKIIQEDGKTAGNQLSFNTHDIDNKGPGASVVYKLDGVEVDFSKHNLTVKGPISGTVEIMKIENEYNVSIKDFEATFELQCDKCLGKFDFQVEIPYMERQFLITDDKFENRFDFFYADTKTHSIDVEEFLRQEIILHFPLIAVCSPHCKGINLN